MTQHAALPWRLTWTDLCGHHETFKFQAEAKMHTFIRIRPLTAKQEHRPRLNTAGRHIITWRAAFAWLDLFMRSVITHMRSIQRIALPSTAA
ncbi:MAG: hypothetical protein CMP47_06305 [Rickettsiales bacterium]|nr:hypothetical protein [Rickettsiales bacterium]